jgi:hypothetical protein
MPIRRHGGPSMPKPVISARTGVIQAAWVSQGRFRVVGCGAFRLGFDGGLGGEAENMSLVGPVVRQVLAQSQSHEDRGHRPGRRRPRRL